jgi:uncharacterized protein (TIGR02466 family)
VLEFISNESNLFPTPMWTVQVTGIDNEEIKNYCYTIKSKSDGVNRSNVGGWHSDPYQIVKPYPNSFKELLVDTSEFVNKYCSQLTGFEDLVLGNYWFNVNQPNTYNQSHDHYGSILSAVYYVEAEGENVGNFEVHRGDAAEYYLKKPDISAGNHWFSFVNYICKPYTGMLLIIPSWVKHSVGINKTDGDRISLAMNFGFKPNE